MKYTSLSASLLILLLSSSPVFGVEGTTRNGCDGLGDERESNSCITEELEAAEMELETIYKRYAESLVDSAPIDSSQKAWAAYVEAECSPGMIVVTESNGRYRRAACKLTLVYRRTDELKWHDEQDCNGCPERKERPN